MTDTEPASNENASAAAEVANLGRAPPEFKSDFERRNGNDDNKPRFRAGGGRIFVGNLETESITRDEFRSIFEQHGEVVEVSLHSSFGFVQFAQESDMFKAMSAEQGRLIGSRKIDIQKAKQDKDKNKGRGGRRGGRSGMNGHRKRGRDDFHNSDNRGREANRPRRDFSRGNNYSNRNQNNQSYGNPRVVAPNDGMVVKIILLGESQRHFAQNVGDAITAVRVPWEIEMLDGRTLSQSLRDSEANKSRYALIVGRDNVNKGTITIKLLHLKEQQGRCPTYDLSVDRLVDLIVSEERKLGFLEAGSNQPMRQNQAISTPNIGLAAQPVQTANTEQTIAALQQQINALNRQVTQSRTLQPNLYQNQLLQPQTVSFGNYNLPNVPTATTGNTSDTALLSMQEKIRQMQNMLNDQVQTLSNLSQNQAQPLNWNSNGNNGGIPVPTSQKFQGNVSHQDFRTQRNDPPKPAAVTSKPSASQLQQLSALLQNIKRSTTNK